MSLSILSFFWRRRSTTSSPSPSLNSEPASFVPSLVTASTSETYGDDDTVVVVIPVTARHAPMTPEGLRPRRPIEEMRDYLHVPARFYGGERTLASTLSRGSRSRLERLHREQSSPTGRVQQASSSWSLQGALSSPPASTSSCSPYSDVATSPNLVPGQARTAVGALVGSQQSLQQQEPVTHDNKNAQSMSILPPRTNDYMDHKKKEEEDYFAHPYSMPDNTTFPGRRYREDETAHLQYQPLNSARNSPVGTPERQPKSPMGSTIAPSPSSLVLKQSHHHHHHHGVEETKEHDVSFSSQARLINTEEDDFHPYDLEPIVSTGTEVVLCQHEDPRNMSAMSQSATMDHETLMSRTVSDDADSIGGDRENTFFLYRDDGFQMPTSKQHRKECEDLFIQALERLQDNVDMVVNVENIIGDTMTFGDWFTKTNIDEENLLTGFHMSKRLAIEQHLTVIIQELERKQTHVDGQCKSSDQQLFASTHEILCDSLHFCRRLVSISIAEKSDKKHQVKDGIQASLGVMLPESPEIQRGGDTSVFSLPPDDHTPMTSNVSVTTTITTHVSPPTNRYLQSSGLQLRRTIEQVASLLQMMTRATESICSIEGDGLRLETETTIRITEEIRRTYQQMVALDGRELIALMDAFEPHMQTTQPRSCNQPMHSSVSRAPASTPPPSRMTLRHDIVYETDDEEDEVGVVMELERRNPANVDRQHEKESREPSSDLFDPWESYDEIHDDRLDLLAGLCQQLVEERE